MIRTILTTSGVRVGALAAQFGVLLLAARGYGPAGSGELSAAVSLVTVAGTLGGLSIGRALVFAAQDAGGRDGRLGGESGAAARLAEVIPTALTLLGGLTVGTALLLAGTVTAVPRVRGAVSPGVLLLIGLALPFYVWQTASSFLYASVERLPLHNILIATTRVAHVVAALVAVRVGITLRDFVILYVVFQWTAFVVELVAFRRLVPRGGARFSGAVARRLVSAGARLHVDTVGGVLITSANTVVINAFLTARDVGVWSLAAQCFAVLLIVPTAAQLSLTGVITRLGPDAAWPATKRYAIAGTGAMAVVAVLGAAVAPWALPFVAGARFAAAVPIFQLLLLGSVGTTAATLLAPQWIARGHLTALSALTIVLGTAGLGLSLVLVPRLGPAGAAWATVSTYTLAMVVHGIVAWRIDRRVRRETPAPRATRDVTDATPEPASR